MNRYFSEIIYQDLNNRYNKSTLTKKELADELGMSVSSINTYIGKGEGIPEYIKVGNAKNGKVLFPVANVVDYLSNTYQVA
ncbi:MAG: hypothetical protein U9N59_03700 [Campylobacterota bacterium]|nr:hypothetical protein [Campylobacterota bacterium]